MEETRLPQVFTEWHFYRLQLQSNWPQLLQAIHLI